MANTVNFDPGIGELAVDFNNYVNDVYSKILNLYSPQQKRARFKLYEDKIYSYMQNNIGFYKGCLLWAYYIKNSNKTSPKEIEGNVFYNMPEEQQNDYDYTVQVNFMDNYFDSFERDSAYYGGKKVLIPSEWKAILALYTEFLELNKSFINTKTTNDIILPKEIENKSFDLSYIRTLFDEVSVKKDLILFLKDEKTAIQS